MFLQATSSQDSNSVWIGGQIEIQGHYKGAITHTQLDSNFTTISEIPLLDGTKRLYPLSQQPTLQNECLVAGLISPNSDVTGEQADVFIAKVNDSGLVWQKTYGHPWFTDGSSFVFKGPTDTTFWFIYAKSLAIDTLNAGTTNPKIHLQAILLSTSGIELENRPITRNWMFSYGQIGIQLADGSIILAYYQGRYNEGYHAIFLKYSINMDLLWTSEPPLPYDPSAVGWYPKINPLDMSPTSDGGFICTGEYNRNGSAGKVWLGKMDGDGCWDVGCSTVFTSILSPPALPKAGGLRLYPNPAANALTIDYADFKNKKIIITDALGRTEKTLTLQGESTPDPSKRGEYLTIDISSLQNGVYYVSLYDGNGLVYSQKLVVLR